MRRNEANGRLESGTPKDPNKKWSRPSGYRYRVHDVLLLGAELAGISHQFARAGEGAGKTTNAKEARLLTDSGLTTCNDGEVSQAIRRFVIAMTTQSGPACVPPADRIAVFENDGTLWVEQPPYTAGR